MLSFKGFQAKDLCDAQLGPTRRTFLRVGGCGMLGLSLPSLLHLEAAADYRLRALNRAEIYHSPLDAGAYECLRLAFEALSQGTCFDTK